VGGKILARCRNYHLACGINKKGLKKSIIFAENFDEMNLVGIILRKQSCKKV